MILQARHYNKDGIQRLILIGDFNKEFVETFLFRPAPYTCKGNDSEGNKDKIGQVTYIVSSRVECLSIIQRINQGISAKGHSIDFIE